MAFMSDLWNSIVGTKDEKGEEVSILYIDKGKKYFTVSEVDKEETVIVFGEAHDISLNKTSLGLDWIPLNFITVYHIDTRKGLFILVITLVITVRAVIHGDTRLQMRNL